MKKIFRMQFEPCLGTCYEYDDILMRELNKLDRLDLDLVLRDLNYIHDKTCGNLTLGFILDYDENLFIGTFVYDNQTQSFVGKNLLEVYSKFRDLIDLYYKEHIGVIVNKHNCDHGRDDNIVSWTKEQIRNVCLV